MFNSGIISENMFLYRAEKSSKFIGFCEKTSIWFTDNVWFYLCMRALRAVVSSSKSTVIRNRLGTDFSEARVRFKSTI